MPNFITSLLAHCGGTASPSSASICCRSTGTGQPGMKRKHGEGGSKRAFWQSRETNGRSCAVCSGLTFILELEAGLTPTNATPWFWGTPAQSSFASSLPAKRIQFSKLCRILKMYKIQCPKRNTMPVFRITPLS